MDRDKRRIALCIKAVCPKIDTHRTRFVEIERPEVAVISPIPRRVTAIEEYGLYAPYKTEHLRLQRWAFTSKRRRECYMGWWVYHESTDTVYHSKWEHIIKNNVGEWIVGDED
jgi:hypothetical protein